MRKYSQPGLFDEHNRHEKLTKQGDPVVIMNEKKI